MIAGIVCLRGGSTEPIRTVLRRRWQSHGLARPIVRSTPASYLMVSPARGPLSRAGVLGDIRGVYWARTAAASFAEDFERYGVTLGRSVSGAYVAVASPRRDVVQFVRDDVGQVPLYWTRFHDSVIFSSVLRDLKDLPGRVDHIDLEVFEQRTRKAYSQQWEKTAFSGVFRARQGGVTTIDLGGVSFESTWDPFAISAVERSFDESVAAMDEAIRLAVDDEVHDTETLGAHLSGGLDSTVCAAYVQEGRRGREAPGITAAFSWSPGPQRPNGPGFHESDLAARLAEHICIPLLHTPPDQIELSGRDPVLDPGETLWREASAVTAAQGLGISAMLSGWGGDEAASFSGRHILVNQLRAGHLVRAWRMTRESGSSRTRSAMRFVRAASLVSRYRQAARTEESRGRDLAQRMLSAHSCSQMIAVQLSNCHITNRIEQWWEEGRRHGIEYRYPLLARGVLEVALQTPDAHWSHGGRGRAVMWELVKRVGVVGQLSPSKGQPDLNRLVWLRLNSSIESDLSAWPEDESRIARIALAKQRQEVRQLLESQRAHSN